MLSSAVPLFIAEIAPTHIRGRLTTTYQLMITIGIAFASCASAVIITTHRHDRRNDMMWRIALIIQACPGFILVGALFLIPESPRWLLAKDREDEALEKLSKLRRLPEQSPEVQAEMHDMKLACDAERKVGSAGWRELLRPGITNRLIVIVILQFFQQWTGINAIMYYSSSLFQGMGLSKDTASTVAVVVQNLFNVFGTLPGAYLVERAGRKKLLFVGGIGIATTMWLLVLFGNLFEHLPGVHGVKLEEINFAALPTSARAYSVLSVIMVYGFILFFAATWGPVVWVYQSEIFPLRIRGKGAGVATMSNWINNAIIATVWPYAQALGANQYIVFACMGMLMSAYVWFFVPETMGRPLEEMDDVFGFAPGSDAQHSAERHGVELKA